MITIVGRIFIIILVSIPSLVFPTSIAVKLATLEGTPLEQAGAGQPFLLNVVVTNTSNSAQYPVIKGINNLHVRQSGFQMNMVNGSTSVTYHYQVRIDTPGSYTLGPAQITEGTNTLESNSVTVIVGTEQKSIGTHARKVAASTPMLKLICDKTLVYVGQPINAQLSFYTADPTTVLQTIIEPEQISANGLVLKNKQNQPNTGTEKINGTEYRFAKWDFQIIATKPGALVVPSYAAQYTNQSNQPMLSFFFHNDAKKVYSNTTTLDVQPLPSSLKAASFIGTVQKFTAQINPIQSRVGQGMVLSLQLHGEGDFDSIAMLPITLPEQLKWYESKKYFTPAENHEGTYTMEYIVQALQPGTITIPKQDFYYFDTNAKRYKTLSTMPITIEVTGTATPESTALALPENVDVSANIDPLAPIHQDGSIQASPTRMVPWPIFWVLLSIIGALWLAYLILTTGRNLIRKILTHVIRKNYSIYESANRHIKKAYLNKKYTDYYFYINELFARRLNITSAQLSPEIIENSLRQDGLSEKAIEDWRIFYAEISQMGFYKQELDEQYYLEITKKAHYWIDVLEQLPRVRL